MGCLTGQWNLIGSQLPCDLARIYIISVFTNDNFLWYHLKYKFNPKCRLIDNGYEKTLKAIQKQGSLSLPRIKWREIQVMMLPYTFLEVSVFIVYHLYMLIIKNINRASGGPNICKEWRNTSLFQPCLLWLRLF